MKKSAILTLLLLCCFSVFLWGCGKKEAEEPVPTPEPEPQLTYCPLDHAVIDTMPSRVYAVAVDNGPKAEPQTNLSQADLVFEVPVEGGINRFLALFYHNQPDVIGPVRSARHYFIELVQSFHAIYVHCGGSEMAYDSMGSVEDIDEMAATSTFWRDKSRNAPVNLYTSWEKLNEKTSENGWNDPQATTEFSFYDEDELTALPQGNATEIQIPYTYKAVGYTWDAAQKCYLRSSDGNSHVDQATGATLTADNIITMNINTRVVDEKGRLDMSFAGNSGSGYLFQNGNFQEITWSMASTDTPLVFTLADGSAAKLVPGHTFIQVVPSQISVSHNGTAPETTEAAGEAGVE